MADITSTVRVAVAVLDQATGPLRAIQSQFKGFGAGLKGAVEKFKGLGDTTGLSKLGSTFSGLAQKAGGVAKSIAGIGLSLVGVGGLAGGFGLSKVVGWMNDMVAAGGALHDTAPKIGVTVEQLQELRHWASMGGVDVGTMEGAVKKLNKNLGDIATGKGKDAAKILESFGVKAGDPRMKSAALMLPVIADGLRNIKDPAQQAQVAMALFGRSGVEMLPALREGAKAMASAAQEARELGLITAAEAAQADAFGEAQEKLAKTIRGVQYAVGAKLLPVLLPVIEAMRQWVAANRDWLAGSVEKAIWGVVNALKAINWAAWGEKLQMLLGLGARFIEMLGGIDKAVLLLAGAKFSGPFVAMGRALVGLVPILGSVATGLLGLVGAPVLLGLAALAAAALLIYQNWDKIGPAITRTWETLKAFAAGFQAGFVAVFEEGFARFREFLGSIGAAVGEFLAPVLEWGQRIGAAFREVFSEITGLLAAVGRRLGQEFADALEPLVALVLEWGRSLLGAFKQVWDSIKGSAAGAFDAIAPGLTTALEPIRAQAARAWEGIKQVFKAGTEGVLAYIEPLRAALGSIMGTLEKAVGFVERGLRGLAGLVRGAREDIEAAAEAEATADAMAQRAADKAALKQRREAERAAEAAAGPPPLPAGRGPGPWLPEVATPQGAPANGRVDVVIKAENQPPGTRVAAKATGQGVRTQTDVGVSMPWLQPAGAT
jgi:hypothetical protein